MRVLVKQRDRNEQGAVAVLVGVMAIMLCVIGAFSVDLGMSYKSRMELRTAADAGALAAAGVYAQQDGIMGCEELKAAGFAAANAQAKTFGDPNLDTTNWSAGDIVPQCVDGALEVTFTVTGSTPTFFGRLVPGMGDAITKQRSATAVVDVPPAVGGLRPLALCAWEEFDPNQRSGFLTIPIPDAGNGGGGESSGAIWTGPDTDKGGAPNSLELALAYDINDPADDEEARTDDYDDDNLINELDSAPTNRDRDGDGIPDGDDAQPSTASECPDFKNPGNWWTINCPGVTSGGEGGEGGLAAAIRDGCKSPVAIVPGQPAGASPGDLSTYLRNYCTSSHPESCLEANKGNFSGGDNSGAIAAFTELANTQKAVVFPIFCGLPWCTPLATITDGKAVDDEATNSNVIYPVYRLIGATVCGFHLKNQTTNVKAGDCANAPNVTGNDSELVLAVHSVIVSGVTSPSTCQLGALCDSGARRVLMVK